MRIPRFGSWTALLPLILGSATVWADLGGFVGLEARGFPDPGLWPEQGPWDASAVFQPELSWKMQGAEVRLVPFLRLDSQDPRRTHADLREAQVGLPALGWDWQFGVGKVFWGAAESNHLVDVVNQTDLVEDPDGESKLGQPMVRATRRFAAGSLDLFLLPGFRERTFPGPKGRLYLPLDLDHPVVETSPLGLDLAAHLSLSLGSWDLGLGVFYGTRRDPHLVPDPASGLARLHYDVIAQVSLDLQVASGPWLWRLEAFYRQAQEGDYPALVGGFEYSLRDIAGTGADLGLLAEYNWDGREQELETAFQNDLFLGLRLALNDPDDTRILAGVAQDLDHDGLMWRLEASRRLGERWRLALALQGFPRVSPEQAQYWYREDGYARLEIQRWL